MENKERKEKKDKKCMINFYYFIKHSVSTLFYNIPDTRSCKNFLKESEMQYLGIILKWNITQP